MRERSMPLVSGMVLVLFLLGAVLLWLSEGMGGPRALPRHHTAPAIHEQQSMLEDASPAPLSAFEEISPAPDAGLGWVHLFNTTAKVFRSVHLSTMDRRNISTAVCFAGLWFRDERHVNALRQTSPFLSRLPHHVFASTWDYHVHHRTNRTSKRLRDAQRLWFVDGAPVSATYAATESWYALRGAGLTGEPRAVAVGDHRAVAAVCGSIFCVSAVVRANCLLAVAGDYLPDAGSYAFLLVTRNDYALRVPLTLRGAACTKNLAGTAGECLIVAGHCLSLFKHVFYPSIVNVTHPNAIAFHVALSTPATKRFVLYQDVTRWKQLSDMAFIGRAPIVERLLAQGVALALQRDRDSSREVVFSEVMMSRAASAVNASVQVVNLFLSGGPELNVTSGQLLPDEMTESSEHYTFPRCDSDFTPKYIADQCSSSLSAQLAIAQRLRKLVGHQQLWRRAALTCCATLKSCAGL